MRNCKFISMVILLFLLSGCTNPAEEIISHSERQFGKKFKEGRIDLLKVFDFPWDTLYIFYPLIYPEDIENDTGINYKGNVVPDDTYLFVFVSDGTIIREIKSRPFRISFENELMGLNSIKIRSNDAKFLIKATSPGRYRMIKIH